MVIESVAWNRPALLTNTTSTSTREILIGARNGTIYEASLDARDDFFKSQERYIQSVFTLPERQPITGIDFVHFPPNDFKKGLVLVTTKERIYQFVGNLDRRSDDAGKVFNTLFAAYGDTVPSELNIRGGISHTNSPQDLLNFEEKTPALNYTSIPLVQTTHNPSQSSWPGSPVCPTPSILPPFLSLTKLNHFSASGIYHGTLKYTAASPSDDLIDSPSLRTYHELRSSSSSDEAQNQALLPIGMGITEFHFVLLYPDRVVAVRRLDYKIIYEEILPLVSP